MLASSAEHTKFQWHQLLRHYIDSKRCHLEGYELPEVSLHRLF